VTAKRSPYTELKQACLTEILQPWFQIIGSLIRRDWHPRVYVADLNAGPGIYRDGLDGSPMIIERLLHAAGLPHDSYFFERDRSTAAQLGRALDDRAYCGQVIVGNHYETIHRHVKTLPRCAKSRLGIIYADSNGQRIPVEVITAVLRQPGYWRIDVLINQPARAYKRRRGAGLDRESLADDLRALGKKHLQVRDFGTNQDWVFLLATNWPDPARFRHFVDLESERGRCLLERRDETKAEHQRRMQIGLWPTGAIGSTSPILATERSAPSSSSGPAAGASDATGAG
jgi:three-Cys-motif partner protein